MQAQNQAGRFVRLRRMAEIFGAERREQKLFLAGDFPQKIQVDFVGHGVRCLHHLGRIGRSKLQQHILSAHLAAFAALHLDLIRLALLRQCDAGLEVARFFEK